MVLYVALEKIRTAELDTIFVRLQVRLNKPIHIEEGFIA